MAEGGIPFQLLELRLSIDYWRWVCCESLFTVGMVVEMRILLRLVSCRNTRRFDMIVGKSQFSPLCKRTFLLKEQFFRESLSNFSFCGVAVFFPCHTLIRSSRFWSSFAYYMKDGNKRIAKRAANERNELKNVRALKNRWPAVR